VVTETVRASSGHRRRDVLQRMGWRREAPAAPTTALAAAAQSAGWNLHRSQASFLADLDRVLAAQPSTDVAVLVGAHPTPIGQIVAEAYPRARIHMFGLDSTRSTLHTRMAAAGPFGVLVDDTRHGDQHARVLRDTFFHLRAGGALVVRDYRSEPDPRRTHAPVADLPSLLAELLHDRHEDAATTFGRRRDQVMLAKSIREVTIGERHLVLTSGVDALAKLREEEADRVLDENPANGRVITAVPGLTFASRAESLTGIEDDDHRRPQTFPVPRMSLRDYADVVCAPGQVAVRGNLLLPDSFRHNQYPRLRNRWTIDLAPGFAQEPRLSTGITHLPGTYFYLDAEWRGHFGHMMTDQLPRMWGWAEAKRAHPDLKALLSLAARQTRLSDWQLTLFAAVGIPADDVVTFDAPVHVDRLVAATSMFSMPSYVHPDIEPLWNQLGRTLAADARAGDYPSRIFVSRRPSTLRHCRNTPELESFFADRGYEIVFPDELPLSEQAATFQRADVIAGLTGSGLFSLMYAETPKDVIILSPTSFTSSNEYLIAAVRGHRIHQIWSEPDIEQPASGWSQKAYESDFAFDFDNEGVTLQGILAELDR
jgi:capsular polysaccharide biosynthesis protein